jgi:acyl-coenzyme A thioesterase PaaI-like protein
VSGRYSPLAPPVELSVEGSHVVGVVTFASAYEGPPGSVHGGIVAGVYDQLLAFANIVGGVPGPTASLSVQYRRPTPLGVELRFEAWTERAEGRKVWARGTCHVGGEQVSEAEGLFICVDAAQAARIWPGAR